jgi:hypothetical protein
LLTNVSLYWFTGTAGLPADTCLNIALCAAGAAPTV